MSTIIQLNLQSILENRLVIYILLALLFIVAAVALYLQLRRQGEVSSRTITHLEAIRTDLRSISENNAKMVERLGFSESYTDDQKKIEASLDRLHQVCAGTIDAIHAVSSATVETLSNYFQEQEEARRAAEQVNHQRELGRREEEALQDRLIRIEEARRRYRALAESEVCRISALVADISERLAAQSPLTNGCAKAIRSYLELDSRVKDVAETIRQLDPAIEGTFDNADAVLGSLAPAIEDLDQRHRPAWCIGLLDLARRSPAVETQSKRLTNLLGLEEVRVTPGSDLRDYNSLSPEIVDSDGDGSKSVITELVEVGYKNRETGAVLKPPKVKVRFEG